MRPQFMTDSESKNPVRGYDPVISTWRDVFRVSNSNRDDRIKRSRVGASNVNILIQGTLALVTCMEDIEGPSIIGDPSSPPKWRGTATTLYRKHSPPMGQTKQERGDKASEWLLVHHHASLCQGRGLGDDGMVSSLVIIEGDGALQTDDREDSNAGSSPKSGSRELVDRLRNLVGQRESGQRVVLNELPGEDDGEVLSFKVDSKGEIQVRVSQSEQDGSGGPDGGWGAMQKGLLVGSAGTGIISNQKREKRKALLEQTITTVRSLGDQVSDSGWKRNGSRTSLPLLPSSHA